MGTRKRKTLQTKKTAFKRRIIVDLGEVNATIKENIDQICNQREREHACEREGDRSLGRKWGAKHWPHLLTGTFLLGLNFLLCKIGIVSDLL